VPIQPNGCSKSCLAAGMMAPTTACIGRERVRNERSRVRSLCFRMARGVSICVIVNPSFGANAWIQRRPMPSNGRGGVAAPVRRADKSTNLKLTLSRRSRLYARTKADRSDCNPISTRKYHRLPLLQDLYNPMHNYTIRSQNKSYAGILRHVASWQRGRSAQQCRA
jgi:hypothetical protein